MLLEPLLKLPAGLTVSDESCITDHRTRSARAHRRGCVNPQRPARPRCKNNLLVPGFPLHFGCAGTDDHPRASAVEPGSGTRADGDDVLQRVPDLHHVEHRRVALRGCGRPGSRPSPRRAPFHLTPGRRRHWRLVVVGDPSLASGVSDSRVHSPREPQEEGLIRLVSAVTLDDDRDLLQHLTRTEGERAALGRVV